MLKKSNNLYQSIYINMNEHQKLFVLPGSDFFLCFLTCALQDGETATHENICLVLLYEFTSFLRCSTTQNNTKFITVYCHYK